MHLYGVFHPLLYVTIIVTSTQSDRQSISGVTKRMTPQPLCLSSMNLNIRNSRPKGAVSSSQAPHKATRKFYIFWCLRVDIFSHSFTTACMLGSSKRDGLVSYGVTFHHPILVSFPTCCENGFYSEEDTSAERIYL